MPSFDIVSQVNEQEVKNAVEQTNKEITNRYDFKGSDARVEMAKLDLTVFADDEFKLGQVMDVLRERLAKRNVDVALPRARRHREDLGRQGEAAGEGEGRHSAGKGASRSRS